jgi:hypothetical protein
MEGMRYERLIHQQHGVISREQALACGITPQRIQTLLDRRDWEAFFPSVYWVKAVPRTPLQRLWAALLWAGESCCLSHGAAAWIWKLPGFESLPWKIDVLGPRTLGPAPTGISAHRPRDFEENERIIHRGLQVTSLPRTLFDLAPRSEAATLERALDAARRYQPEVLIPQLAAVIQRHRGPGQAGLKELIRMVSLRIDLEATDSWLEDEVLKMLLRAALPRPRHQFEVWDGAEYVMRVDFFWEHALLALHVDGFAFHSDPAAAARDAKQRRQLARLGIRSISVTYKDLAKGEFVDDVRVLLGVAKQADLGLVVSNSQND